MHWQVFPWADAARGMFAAGTAPNGDLVVLSTGHANTVASRPGRGPVTPTWISRSANGGRTWSLARTGFPKGPDGAVLNPFGDSRIEPHAGYHRDVAIWDPAKTFP